MHVAITVALVKYYAFMPGLTHNAFNLVQNAIPCGAAARISCIDHYLAIHLPIRIFATLICQIRGPGNQIMALEVNAPLCHCVDVRQ